MGRFSGKTVLITGAASGIGRASAQAFAAEGASLYLCDINGEGLQGVADALPGQVKFADSFGDAVDFKFAIDCYTVYPQRSAQPEAYLPLWTPQDPRVFYSDTTARDIDLSFIGSTARYADREGAFAGLAHAGIVVTQSGGQREQPLSIEAYAAMLQRSKVTLDYSKVFAPEVPSHQFKGRVLAAMLCGAL